MRKMSSIGAFVGGEENRFNPKRNITKEEVITILFRLNEKL